MDILEVQYLKANNELLERVFAAANGVLAVHCMGGDLNKAVVEMQRVISHVQMERNFIAGGSFMDVKKRPLSRP